MMALRQTPAEYAFVHALDGAPLPRKLSSGVVIAIGISIGVHLALAAYVIHQKFMAPQPAVDDTPTMVVGTFTLPKPAPPTETPTQRARTLQPHVAPATFDLPHQVLTNIPIHR